MTTSKKGFTLLELLVVVAIIGVLAAIIISSINQARSKSNIARMAIDLKERAKAIALFRADHSDKAPCFDHDWSMTREAAWPNPYFKWAQTPGGRNYHWEHGQQGFNYSISIQSPGLQNAQALDDYMDDGNLTTGIIRGNGSRLEYGGVGQSPSFHQHYTALGACPYLSS